MIMQRPAKYDKETEEREHLLPSVGAPGSLTARRAETKLIEDVKLQQEEKEAHYENREIC
jgi:hypothetical protein